MRQPHLPSSPHPAPPMSSVAVLARTFQELTKQRLKLSEMASHTKAIADAIAEALNSPKKEQAQAIAEIITKTLEKQEQKSTKTLEYGLEKIYEQLQCMAETIKCAEMRQCQVCGQGKTKD